MSLLRITTENLLREEGIRVDSASLASTWKHWHDYKEKPYHKTWNEVAAVSPLSYINLHLTCIHKQNKGDWNLPYELYKRDEETKLESRTRKI